MKKGSLLILLIIGIIFFFNCVKATEKEWTILIYLGGDGHLEPNAIVDFNAFEVGIDTTYYNVVIQLDRVLGYDNSNGNWTTCKRFLLSPDKLMDGVFRSTELADIGEVNMGNPQTLADFITWGMQNFQAKRYAVVVWGSAAPMGICPDLTSSNDPLNVMSGEITSALRLSTQTVHRRIDLFVPWGCNYGTFEHDYVVKEYVDVTVRSELATWNAEGSATDILEWLNLNPNASPQEFAKAWVNAYTEYAISKGRCTGWAALDLNPRFVKLSKDLDIFARELIKAGGKNQPDIAKALSNTVYCYNMEFDLYHFSKNISNIPSLPITLKDAAHNLIDTYGYSSPYNNGPLLNFRFSEGIRASNETWPIGDANELRGSKIYQTDYSDFEGNPIGGDTAYVPFKMNNAWKWFIAGSLSLPNEVLLTYDSNSIGDSLVSNGMPVLLNVTLRNSGGADASDISAVLSTSDPNVNISQPNSVYLNIISEGTQTNSSAFQIDIDTSITNGNRIWFRLDITANNGAYTNTSTFCMETKKSTIMNSINYPETEYHIISVYPNPAMDFIIIPGLKGMNIEIFTVLGTKLINTICEDRIDVSFLNPGIYYIKTDIRVFKFVKL